MKEKKKKFYRIFQAMRDMVDEFGGMESDQEQEASNHDYTDDGDDKFGSVSDGSVACNYRANLAWSNQALSAAETALYVLQSRFIDNQRNRVTFLVIRNV